MVRSGEVCKTNCHETGEKTQKVKDEICLCRQDNMWAKTRYNRQRSLTKASLIFLAILMFAMKVERG